jgi:hypothetical protein
MRSHCHGLARGGISAIVHGSETIEASTISSLHRHTPSLASEIKCCVERLRPPVERQTRYVTLAKIANKDTHTVASALIQQAKTIPNELYKSLTWDGGKELADHRRFTLATNIDVYFCDPQTVAAWIQ